MSLDFSVVIPTYNGENRLLMVLEKLQAQTGVEKLQWEIIVVDNNSSDRTAKLVQEYQANWQHPFPLRYILEPEQGAAFARTTGVHQAKGELVGFLDDDNLPAVNWIIEAYKFAQNYPQAGALASQIHGAFAVEPPADIKPILFYLAITERGNQPHIYEPRMKGFPPTAGLVVRRDVWRDNVKRQLFFIGRIGSSMIGGEDAESLFYIHKAGWEIWYNPAMEIDHIIPAWRLEKDYLHKLMRGVGLSRYYLRMLLLQPWQKPLFFFLYLLNDTRKLIVHYLRHNKTFYADMVATCEMERLRATWISPFYLGWTKINNLFRYK
ncbi:MAG: hormogonium polysaccharide biosynthesis glycosyltransferase HpsE [Nostocaceae cyanobacterium]|nr:hormogonium polysaccharide biosynthesis glycosyltransferase HpsE [Nostocaceae cyanobacterium]